MGAMLTENPEAAPAGVGKQSQAPCGHSTFPASLQIHLGPSSPGHEHLRCSHECMHPLLLSLAVALWDPLGSFLLFEWKDQGAEAGFVVSQDEVSPRRLPYTPAKGPPKLRCPGCRGLPSAPSFLQYTSLSKTLQCRG